MEQNTLVSAPATILKALAEQSGQAEVPVRIRTNDDRVGLAAAVLWSFATQTGLDRESESLETVLTDFLGDLLHLCEQCDPGGSGPDSLNSALRVATMHFEHETGHDNDTII